jgi:hypothetical protein
LEAIDMRRLLCTALVGVLLLVGSAHATLAAPVTAVIPGGGGFQNHAWNFDATLGYEFSLSTTLDVSALGFFDADDDGLFDAHDVGIFAADGTLLASATLPSGTGATLQDGFRFVSIPDLVLAPGIYRIGAQGNETSLDEFLLTQSGSTTIGGLTLGAAFYGFGAALTFPTAQADYATEGFFGPNFQATRVPEPATLTLTVLALTGALRRARRAR